MHLGNNTEGQDQSPVTYWVNRANGKVVFTNDERGNQGRIERGFEQVTAEGFAEFTKGKVFK